MEADRGNGRGENEYDLSRYIMHIPSIYSIFYTTSVLYFVCYISISISISIPIPIYSVSLLVYSVICIRYDIIFHFIIFYYFLPQVMGGPNSAGYQKFVALTTNALSAVRKYTNEFLGLMEILAYKSNYPAFSYNPNAMKDLRDRMMPTVSDEDLPAKVVEMMNKSYKHSGAIRYDKFQVLTNGIAR